MEPEKKKKIFELGDIEMPPCVKEQILRFFVFALLMLALGILMLLISFSWLIAAAVMMIVLTIACMGYYRAYMVTRYGYSKVQGICEKVDYTFLSRAGGRITQDIPKRYLIKVKDKIYAIPYYRHNPLISEKDKVVMYLKPDEESFEWNGVVRPSVIYGYEIIFEDTDE